jgi:hypothetical protein
LPQPVFYCETGSSFVSLDRNNFAKLTNLIRMHLPNNCSTTDFLRGLGDLNNRLQLSSKNEFDMYAATAALMLNEPRLVDLTAQFERVVMERFV